jgi:hypothetical protein
MRHVQRGPHEQTQGLPDVHGNCSVVRQMFGDSPLGRLADVRGKEELTHMTGVSELDQRTSAPPRRIRAPRRRVLTRGLVFAF